MTLEQALSAFPLGAPVRFYPDPGRPSFVRAKIRSCAVAFDGLPKVRITGRAGWVSVHQIARDA